MPTTCILLYTLKIVVNCLQVGNKTWLRHCKTWLIPNKDCHIKSILTLQKCNRNKAAKLTCKIIKSLMLKQTTKCTICPLCKTVDLINSCNLVCYLKIICHFKLKTLCNKVIYNFRDNNYSITIKDSNYNSWLNSLRNRISSYLLNPKKIRQTYISSKCTWILMFLNQSRISFKHHSRFH